ncbi:MAG: RNA-binding protein [Azospira oryzae]|nr:MAG: RNA-binding protein [Azospira oryzae]
MNKKILPSLLAVLILLAGCHSRTQPALMELLSPQQTNIDFINALDESEDLNLLTFEYFYNGAGVGIGDINNDGLQDVFFAANMRSNRMYLNKGDFQFEDITESAGLSTSGKWATGVAMVDINQDGWMDIYVCYAGPYADPEKRANELYINNGNGTFTNRATAYGLADTGHSVQAAFLDYDKDGDLDVYLLTNITDRTGPNIIRHKRLNSEMANTDRLYRNNGNLTFTDVSKQSGITAEGYGLGVSICDLNHDGWPDVYVTNDYLSNDLLYINNHDGTFTDHLADYFQHTCYSAMGNDIADFNNDGLTDVVAVDMLPPDNKRQKMMFGTTNYDRYRSEIMYGYTPQYMRNTLQLNGGTDQQGQTVFSEVGQLAGIEATDWSWSPLFADLDNDGRKDIVITNGYARDITNRDFVSYRMQEFMQQGEERSSKRKKLQALQSIDGPHLPIVAFGNSGHLNFTNQSIHWGFSDAAYSTGAAYADLDNDGDLDYVTNNINAEAFVYRNNARGNGNHFLQLAFKGSSNNRDGYGTKAWVYTSDTLQYLELSPIRGYQSSVQQSLHFGLGDRSTIDSLKIIWPDGRCQRLKNIPADQTLVIDYRNSNQDTANYLIKQNNSSPLFRTAVNNRSIVFKHTETEYADFKIEPLLPHKYSENGPGIAVGDINGDGLEDFFVGGGYNQSGHFFLQQRDGNFKGEPLTTEIKYEEDMGALLFDADGDRDNDLLVTGGGNEFADGSKYYEDRLYVNDGKGNFRYDRDALPSLTGSASCIIAADYDKDGDLDLFIGGRLTPHQFPHPGQSYLLQNDKGHFIDITDQAAPGLRYSGMVSAALWTDVDNDHEMDLILAGEWMPVTVYKNSQGHFRPEVIANTSGWWNSIQGADMDEDGDTDYLLGNLGLNTRYKASPQQPVSVYIDDFNHDGKEDALIGMYIQGVNRPAHPRDDLFLQMPQLKKLYPSYSSYCDVSIDQLLKVTKTTPKIIQSQTFQTSYLENKGKDGWKLTPLPVEAQVAPVFGIIADDFDGDGHMDAVLTGNSYATEVLTGRYDAFQGLFLKGDGKGKFRPTRIAESGMRISGNVKGLAQLTTGKESTLLLAARNNDTIEVIEQQLNSQHVIVVRPQDTFAITTFADGHQSKKEFYFGSGYLSQSSRAFRIPEGSIQLTIVDVSGNRRVVAVN